MVLGFFVETVVLMLRERAGLSMIFGRFGNGFTLLRFFFFVGGLDRGVFESDIVIALQIRT